MTNLKLKSEVSAPAAGGTPQTPFLRSTSSPMKPRTGEEDFARLPAFELEGLFGAVLRPPPCTLLITHKGKQLGFLLTLDIDEEVANIIIEICSAREKEEGGQQRRKWETAKQVGRVHLDESWGEVIRPSARRARERA